MIRHRLRMGAGFAVLTLMLWLAWGDAAAGARPGVTLWNNALELVAQHVKPPMRVAVPR